MQKRDMMNSNIHINNGELPRDRSIFTIISMICMMVLSLLLVLLFIIISDVLVAGQGLYTHTLCVVGTWICLMFYTGIKAVIYVFLVERIHVVRAPFMNRKNDKIYLACMTMIVVMYGAVAINSYVNHVTEMKGEDGRCHFGIRGIVSIPFTVVNFFTDAVLTTVFFYLLQPVVQKPGTSTIAAMIGKKSGDTASTAHGGADSPARKNIRILLWKSIIGSLLIEIPTAANMIQFVITKGEELGMICLTICLVDVCWDALVIHWLTFSASGSAAERELSRSTMLSSQSSSNQIRGNSQSQHSSQDEAKILTGGELPETHIGALDFICDEPSDSSTGLLRPAPVKR
ncbi:hypothetical protein DDE82_000738 [Stemphylium lycopersici]|uniref:Uncharacterized protein n=1 Tax=Stemphylium lycopersici TaxID=183478 RepID=A0A364MXK6_STELY|nr:hypothetical protein TW65_01435 [Stemphylium lycopersici]RAR06583.1 hypothetical protein DDE83_006864 [Stemphylium lycopersici]RAR11264.1 hypothetical protein DDE82_000738 [Stemphylium lycopersici]